MSIRAILIISLITSSQFNVSIAQSVKYDVNIGEAGAETFKAAYGVYDDPALQEYVDNMGQKLVNQLSEDIFEYSFTILDDPTPNAFAMPGGFVFVSRGLLALVQRPDELAGVIGHEIVHVQKRHSIKQMKHSIVPTLLQLPFQVAGGILGGKLGELIELPATAATGAYKASYSRKSETESDKLGIVLAARAGYDPYALSDILDRIAQWGETLNETEEKRSYFSDHPYTPDRIDGIMTIAPQLEWQPNNIDDSTFVQRLNNLLFWNNPSKGVFIDSLFIHPVLDFSIVYPQDWIYSNSATAVSATSQTQNSTLSLSIASVTKSPKVLAKEFVKEIKEHRRRLKIESKPINIADSTAHMVKVTEQLHKDVMTLHIIWLVHGDLVFKFTAMSTTDIQNLVFSTIKSLQCLNIENKEKIFNYRVKIVNSYANDTFESLSTRNGNVLNEEMWKTLNGWNEEDSFKDSRILKVIEKTPFF